MTDIETGNVLEIADFIQKFKPQEEKKALKRNVRNVTFKTMDEEEEEMGSIGDEFGITDEDKSGFN